MALYGLMKVLPTTVGSRSMKTALGTCFPAPVSLKNVLKESSPPPTVLSLGIWPSGWIPCSRQYNSQQALPIWTPAWPIWIEIHSRCKTGEMVKEHNNKFQSVKPFTLSEFKEIISEKKELYGILFSNGSKCDHWSQNIGTYKLHSGEVQKDVLRHLTPAVVKTSNICKKKKKKNKKKKKKKKKKQIHDVGAKVYLHTYNNEKKMERDRFTKKKKKIKQKILGFEPATFRVVGEPSPDWDRECFGTARKLIIYC